MSQPNRMPSIRLTSHLLNLLTVTLGLAAGYFMTIQSLRLQLAAKAEAGVVETLDKRLTNFEVMLREGVVSKEQFYQFSKDTEMRLTRIEQHLVNRRENQLDKR